MPKRAAAPRTYCAAAAASSDDLSVLTIYTDGSHIKGTPRRGYGAWCRYGSGDAEREYELAMPCDGDPAVVSNPTLELRAAADVLERAVVRRPADVATIAIVADYMGVEAYVNMEWRAERAKKPHFAVEARRIQAAVRALRQSGVSVMGHHVRGHTGIDGNDRADALARSAVRKDCWF